MPQLLDRLIGQLRDKGMSEDKARATAIEVLTKSGSLDQDQNLTEKGMRRQAMGASGRAKDRAAKLSGRDPSEYKYDPVTNRATLKNKQ